mmetsp:Transcript_41703/g.104781  ORF Transcript_41703/g.104781 Transcript_41703/m.104781 type:complete len:296 (-) Transcript_41703:1021-1908(-)
MAVDVTQLGHLLLPLEALAWRRTGPRFRLAPEEGAATLIAAEGVLAADVCRSGRRRVERFENRQQGGELAEHLLAAVLVVICREDAGHARVDLYVHASTHHRQQAQEARRDLHCDLPTPQPLDEALHARRLPCHPVGGAGASAWLGVVVGRRASPVAEAFAGATATSATALVDEAQWQKEGGQQDPHQHDAETHEKAELSQWLQHRGEVGEEGYSGRGGGRQRGLARVVGRPAHPGLVGAPLLHRSLPEVRVDKDDIRPEAYDEEQRQEGGDVHRPCSGQARKDNVGQRNRQDDH